MKSHISDAELTALAGLHRQWTEWRVAQELCVARMCQLLGCSEDEAIDMLNSGWSAQHLIETKGIEVHREEYCQTPIEPMRRPRVDGETLLVWGLIVGGVGWVVSAAGIGF